MGKIHKLTKEKQTIYPATITDAVVHPDLKVSTSKLIEEINVSKLFPTGGIDGSNKYTLETAIAKIPKSLQTVGIKCSFLGEDGELETWVWHGGAFLHAGSWTRSDITAVNEKIDSQKEEVDAARDEALEAINSEEQDTIANFNSQRVTPEMLSESTLQLINSSGGGSVTNMADDEDIESKENDLGVKVLKFADRKYNASNFSGRGYKILRKNIVEGKNILAQEMINESNTIYEIRYDFDLNGTEITIPEGCVLRFEGGSLSNGTLKGTNTLIVGSLKDIFYLSITGTWLNKECNPIWWGAKGIDGVDDSQAIQYAFDSPIPIVRIVDRYYISKPISLPYAKSIVGRTGNNNETTGFYANSDFQSVSIDFPDRGGSGAFTQEVKGMFYHRDTTKSELHDIFINARHHADYCVEHIDLYGSIDFYNCYIQSANHVGVLQYACENPVIQQLFIYDCYAGLFISTSKINDTNIFDFSGKRMGAANILHFDSLRVLGCNYGIISNVSANAKFNNLETAYNSILGLYINGGVHEISNYYVEGDGNCDFWIDRNGTKTKTQHHGIALQYLIDNNLDGFATREADIEFGKVIYYRAPIIIRQGQVLFNSAFLSIKPRGKESADVTNISLPDVRTDGGVDCLILIKKPSKVFGKNLSVYILTNNIGAAPYRNVIQSNEDLSAVNSQIDIHFNGRPNANPKLKIVNQVSPGFDSPSFMIDSSSYDYYRGYFNVGSKSNHCYNNDVETKRYGTLKDFDYRGNVFVEKYKNIPLYKRVKSGQYEQIRYSKDEFIAKFGNANQLKVIGYIKVLEDLDNIRININTRFNKGEEYVTGTSLDVASSRSIKAGYYKFTHIFNVNIGDLDYDTVIISFNNATGLNDKILFSDIFFYDLEDADEPVYIYKSVYLPFGTTSERPTEPVIGQQYYDTSINKPIWWTGTKWVDANGTDV